MDVMTKWSRELVMSAVNGRLAITDLLVEGYPTFLRIGAQQQSRTAR